MNKEIYCPLGSERVVLEIRSLHLYYVVHVSRMVDYHDFMHLEKTNKTLSQVSISLENLHLGQELSQINSSSLNGSMVVALDKCPFLPMT